MMNLKIHAIKVIFFELLQFLSNHNDDIKAVILKNALDNLKLTSPDMQKDIASAATIENINVIMKNISSGLFSILTDESRDVSIKEQMAVVLYFVDENRWVIERFIGVGHIANTTALSLKDAIDKLLSKYRLSVSRLRGQDYDGASNMR